MNILFDHNVPDPVRGQLAAHKVSFAREMGWDRLVNGFLLKAAEDAGFDLMITGDKNLSYQQNLKDRKIALVVLGTPHWPTLQQHLAQVNAAVARAKPGSFEELPTPAKVTRKKRVGPVSGDSV